VVWVAATALGLSALLQASKLGYDVLKIAGACYLMWIGVRSLLSARRSAVEVAAEGDGPMAPARLLGGSGFAAGFLTDLLNPKVGVFFVSFLPGFVPHGYAVGWTTLALGAWYTVLSLLYFAGLIALSGTVSAWMSAPRIRRQLDTLTGLVLVAFGLRLATEA
jgi:threonine/homoserine/homoserine lactone efflux protein